MFFPSFFSPFRIEATSSAKPESGRPISSRTGCSTGVPSSRPLSALGPPSSRAALRWDSPMGGWGWEMGCQKWGVGIGIIRGWASCQVLITENDMFNKSKFLNSKVQMFCSKRCFRIGFFENDTWMLLRAVRHISGFRFTWNGSDEVLVAVLCRLHGATLDGRRLRCWNPFRRTRRW